MKTNYSIQYYTIISKGLMAKCLLRVHYRFSLLHLHCARFGEQRTHSLKELYFESSIKISLLKSIVIARIFNNKQQHH